MQDPFGQKTLEIMSKAKNYNRWLFTQILPWLTSPVAEVGAGTGTFSQMISSSSLSVTAIDQNQDYLSSIQKKDPKISVIKANLEVPLLANLKNKFSSVIAINVIEHITDDLQAISNIYSILKPSGKAVILVPAHMWTFNLLDKNLGHVRRYNARSMTSLLKSAGFSIIKVRYLNALGLFGWWFNGTILRKPIIPESQLRFFDLYFPFIKFLEKFIRLPIGLSLLVIAEKL